MPWFGHATRRLAPALALALAAIVAACAGAPGPSAAPATPIPSGVLAVDAKEYAFVPSAITVAASATRLSVRNTGAVEHELQVVQGDQVLGKVEGIGPGRTGELPLTLAAGEYTIICKLNGHDQLGMKGTLTVAPG